MATPAARRKKMNEQRDRIVQEIHNPGSVVQVFGRYDRHDKSSAAKTFIPPKVSRVQLGEQIDVSTRPPHRVNPVGKPMSTHVDSYNLSRPSDSLSDLVEWGEAQGSFYRDLHLKVLALQARRRGDDAAARSIELALPKKKGEGKPTRTEGHKTARIKRLMNAEVKFTNPKLYVSSEERKARCDPGDVEAMAAIQAEHAAIADERKRQKAALEAKRARERRVRKLRRREERASTPPLSGDNGVGRVATGGLGGVAALSSSSAAAAAAAASPLRRTGGVGGGSWFELVAGQRRHRGHLMRGWLLL